MLNVVVLSWILSTLVSHVWLIPIFQTHIQHWKQFHVGFSSWSRESHRMKYILPWSHEVCTSSCEVVLHEVIWLPSPYDLPILHYMHLCKRKFVFSEMLVKRHSLVCCELIQWMPCFNCVDSWDNKWNFTFTLLLIIDVQGWDWEHLVHKQQAHLFCYNDSSHFFQGRLNICL